MHIISTLILILSSMVVYSQVGLIVETNRVSGVAPLYVFFDATASTGLNGDNDLANADFTWYFYGNGSEPFTKGMVAGYVFEEPGNYTVRCRVIAPDGSEDFQSIDITVAPFDGTTYYVSAEGDDDDDGSLGTPWQTAQHALSQISGNQRILFRRGDSFDTVEESIEDIESGPIILGAYGDGAAPILTSEDMEVLDVDNSSDVRLMDLHLMPLGTGPFGAGGITVNNYCENILALRIEIEGGVGRSIFQDESDAFGVFDCNLHDFGVIGVFSGRSTRFSYVGNTIDNLIGAPQPEHGVRIQGGEKQFVANNIFTDLHDTKTALTIRGDGQRHVMIYNNRMDRILGVNPQNAQTIAAITDVTIESNYIGQNPDYVGELFEPTINGINIEATRVVVRNNVIDGYRNGVFVGNDGNGVLSGIVDVYHNTFHWRAVTPQSNTSGRIVRVRESFDVDIQNNLLSAASLNEISVLNQDAASFGITESNNFLTENPEYLTTPLPSSEASNNNILNYRLTETSPYLDMADNQVPVFYDALNQSRPHGSQKDPGAFEYINQLPPLEEPEPDPSEPQVYPNPVTDILYIDHAVRHWNWYVFDSTSNMVLRGHTGNRQIDLSALNDGVYIIYLKNPEGIYERRIVKSN